ncbi:hypothetical protein HFO98_07885 [Rhizobium leguminosarum]|uniref:hypothetical protein n=1 Tax=Rhizobium leguminosarum TaxID=384 RepID=UPI001C9742DC|nr:hypothetical protein [Rhizobium leguminosarum]MBY5408397.1 hypothetical protein [Rhizobium leguminosarum]
MSDLVTVNTQVTIDTPEEIEEARSLRERAVALRASVAKGSYTQGELEAFRSIISSAGVVLMVSNIELAEHAGVGRGYIGDVVNKGGRPKLTNFLSCLSAVIAVADQRLGRIRTTVDASAANGSSAPQRAPLESRHDLFLLATSLSQIAAQEISRLDGERPNDPVTIQRNATYRELLVLLMEGFDRIAAALSAMEGAEPESRPVRQTVSLINAFAGDIERWWQVNGTEFVDWTIRLPVFAAGVAALNLAGANMHIGTAAVATLVGGEKVASIVLKGLKSSE